MLEWLIHESQHIWPEFLGGFAAFWSHHFKHLIYQGIRHLARVLAR